MLRTLLNADVQEYQQEISEQAEYEYFCQHHPFLKKFLDWGRGLKYAIRHYINIHFICPTLGHDRKSATFFTEEKGIESWWCDRCGMSGSNRLY